MAAGTALPGKAGSSRLPLNPSDLRPCSCRLPLYPSSDLRRHRCWPLALDDHYCWNRSEDMAYPRPSLSVGSAPDLGAEVAAALAAASIVFLDNAAYSKKLSHGAATVYKFARQSGRRTPYSLRQPDIEYYYNSTSYWDKYMWSAAWMYYATGNSSYISFATDPRLPKNAKAFFSILDFSVFSWDNKLPGAQLLLSRLRCILLRQISRSRPPDFVPTHLRKVKEMASQRRLFVGMYNISRQSAAKLNGSRKSVSRQLHHVFKRWAAHRRKQVEEEKDARRNAVRSKAPFLLQ